MGQLTGRPGPDPYEIKPPADTGPPPSQVWIEGLVRMIDNRKRLTLDKLRVLAVELGFIVHETPLSDIPGDRPRRSYSRGDVSRHKVQDYISKHPGCTVQDLVTGLYRNVEPWTALHQRAAVLRAHQAINRLREIGWIRRYRMPDRTLLLFSFEHADQMESIAKERQVEKSS